MSDKIITIATFTTIVQAKYVTDLLEKEGIKVMLSGENTISDNALQASAVGNIRVQIFEKDAEKADVLIDKAREQLDLAKLYPIELEEEVWQEKEEEIKEPSPISAKDHVARNIILIIAASVVLLLLGFKALKHSGFLPEVSGPLEAIFTLEPHVNAGSTCDLESTASVLKDRLLAYGLSKRSVDVHIEGGRIIVHLKRFDDFDRIRRLLSQKGNLEFWITFENHEFYQYLVQANKVMADIVRATMDGSEDTSQSTVSLLNILESRDSVQDLENATLEFKNPLFSKLQPAGYANNAGEFRASEGPVIGYVALKDTVFINTSFQFPEIKRIFPNSVKFLWEVQPFDTSGKYIRLIAGKYSREGKAAMTNPLIHKAYQDIGKYTHQPEIVFTMKDKEAEDWALLTRYNVGKTIAICIDEKVYSYPRVNAEIRGGRCSISGGFTIEQAKEMAAILNSRPLSCKLRIVNEELLKGTWRDFD